MARNPNIRRALMPKVRAAAQKAVKAGAANMLRHVGDVADAASPGGGVTYTRGGRQHTASAPGDPWASDTGNARQSMTVDLREIDSANPSARVGPALGHVDPETGEEAASYVERLEYGTRTVQARPTMRTAAENGRDGTKSVMGKVFAQEMRK